MLIELSAIHIRWAKRRGIAIVDQNDAGVFLHNVLRKMTFKGGEIMRNYAFNDSTGYFEIDPRFLKEGIQIAEKESYHSIRIRNLNLATDLKCHLDFSSFNNKTFINKLLISDNFKLSKYQNIEALYTLCNLTEVTLGQPIKLNLNYFKKMEEVVVEKDYYLNLDKLINVKRLYAIKYMKPDCKEFCSLKSLEFFYVLIPQQS